MANSLQKDVVSQSSVLIRIQTQPFDKYINPYNILNRYNQFIHYINSFNPESRVLLLFFEFFQIRYR